MADETNDWTDLIVVREVLAREIETINSYQSLLGRSGKEEVRTFLTHIIEEEKEHVAEAVELIKDMDPTQAELLKTGHVLRNGSDPGPASVESKTKPTSIPSLTVGSLRQQSN